MKTLLAATAAMLFTVNAAGHDVYRGLAEGNSDLFDQHPPTERMAGVQPSVGDSFDRYWGLAHDNPDLFKSSTTSVTPSHDPQIYQELGGNPDLSY